MSHALDGRHAVVTGGGRGLGAAIAQALAGRGADVTLMGRSLEAIQKQAEHLSSRGARRARAVACDVTNRESVVQAFDEATRSFGPVHVLVNNAGYAPAAPVVETSIEDWQQTIAVNLTGAFLCIQQVLPAMIQAHEGRIVNIASTAGLRGYARVAAYCAAKHGVIGLTRALAAETRKQGIAVNAVCPGYIDGSPMLQDAIANVARLTGKSREEARATLAKDSRSGLFVTIAAVAALVGQLCADEPLTTTGQAIEINGGAEQP